MALAGYEYFLRTARSLQWDADEIDLSEDAAAWPNLSPRARDRVMGLIAGFCVAEWAVADELPAFAEAINQPAAAACFSMQDGDELRHSAFFDRVVAEVAEVSGDTRDERRAAVRHLVPAQFLDLFEEALPQRAARVGRDGGLLAGVGLYHMVLEGIVLIAGQFAFFEVLDELDCLPGLRQGVGLVHRDERWHIGFGARCLQDLDVSAEHVEQIVSEGESAVDAWGWLVSPHHSRKMMQMHRRRLRATGLLPAQRTSA